ncbi:MAG: SpoIIE family protein phosphatase [Clostridiales Family XIII bacterium]|jgi:sigma-B regulation protein RsbU (phosphoserine phosphatase)|nr:SpoIIE family protein phosphatase [Clostridiales Family XIII bacterium]
MKNLRFNLQVKFALSFTVLAIVLSVIISLIGYFNYINGIITESEKHVLAVTKSVAASIDGEEVARFIESGAFTPHITEIQTLMTNVRLNGNVAFHYMFRLEESAKDDEITYVLMGYNPDELTVPYAERPKRGDTEIYSEELYNRVLSVWRGEAGELVVDDKTDWGYLLSAFVPIERDGEVIAVLSTDFPMDYIRDAVIKYLLKVIFGTLAALLALLAVCLRIMRKSIVDPIHTLRQNAMNIVSDGMTSLSRARTDIRTGDEVEDLSVAFNFMVGELETYIDNLQTVTAERERIGAELAIAREIQAGMLPYIFPPFPDMTEFDIYATMLPAKEVGGDFYDFFLINKTHLAVVIADVSGKGTPAALFMVITKTLLKNSAQYGNSPETVFETVNNQLCESDKTGMFVTAFMGILDVCTGRFVYANAGHTPPLIRRRGRGFELLDVDPCMALAGLEDMSFVRRETVIEEGDMLYLYTDGVTEATDSGMSLFGEQRLLKAADRYCECDLAEMLAGIKTEIDLFAGSAEQADDITMLALKYNGGAASANLRKEAEPESDERVSGNDKAPVTYYNARRGLQMEEISIEAKIEHLETVLHFVTECLERRGCDFKLRTQISLAVEEIFVNIANYAYAPGSGNAIVRVAADRDIVIEFEDGGVSYNPLERSDPDMHALAHERKIGGLGVFLVKNIMDGVEYRNEDGRNILTMVKAAYR